MSDEWTLSQHYWEMADELAKVALSNKARAQHYADGSTAHAKSAAIMLWWKRAGLPLIRPLAARSQRRVAFPAMGQIAERRNASEPRVFGELSTGGRNHLAWAPTAAERNDAVSRPRNVV